MIEYSTGSIFECDAEALVNPVNCKGIAGKGLALEFKKRFPVSFDAYRHECQLANLCGECIFLRDGDRYIGYFFTKNHWINKSQLSDIATGLQDLIGGVKFHGIQSIAIPALGCGLGGLDWGDVKPLIESAAQSMPNVRVIVFPPKG